MKEHLIIIDDDRFLLDNLRRLMEANGYEVTTAANGAEGWERITERTPSLLILDLGLPDQDGVTLCRRIRSEYRFPVIMLTARSGSSDKVLGLETGADDYLSKPFDPAELVARVRAQIRRSRNYGESEGAATEVKNFGPIEIDFGAREVRARGNVIPLTATEFDLLAYLAKNAGRALSREQIFESVWKFDLEFGSNSLEVFVYRLRLKLEPYLEGELIQTVRGYGYRLEYSERARKVPA